VDVGPGAREGRSDDGVEWVGMMGIGLDWHEMDGFGGEDGC
jgi:hypothetical protein